MRVKSFKVAVGLAVAVMCSLAASAVNVDVAVSKPGHEVPASLWGIFLEDIAFSVDGCLYPELVWNRGFEFRPAPSDDGFERRLKGPMDLGIPGLEVNEPLTPETIDRAELELFGRTYPEPVRMERQELPPTWK